MARRLTRRQMLAASAASLGYFHVAPAFSAAKIQNANGKLTVAGIGVGGKGDSDIDHAGGLMEVVALCDVDDGNLGKKAKKWPKAETCVGWPSFSAMNAMLPVWQAMSPIAPVP